MNIHGTVPRTLRARFACAALAVAMLPAAPAFSRQKGAAMKIAAKAQAPKIVALRVHHDLCPYCRKLKTDPAFPKLGRLKADGAVLFVTMDMTDEATQKQSALLIGALGLQNLWPADLSTLGTITFVNWETKKVISTIRSVDVASIRSATRDALASARGAPKE